MEDLNKIKDRIAKLLRMAADASSPNEAAIAASRARALMDKHQLEVMDIDQSIKEEFDSAPPDRAFAALPEYLNWFATAVAKYNDCQHMIFRAKVDFKKKESDSLKWGKQSVFRGYKSDVALAVDMYNRLNDAVNRLCKEWMKEQGYTSYSVRIGGHFKHGAFQIIADRLEQMTKERDSIQCATGTALVLIKSTAVSNHFGEVKYKEGKGRDMDDHDEREARRAGHIKGKLVEIVKSLDESIKEPGSGTLRLN